MMMIYILLLLKFYIKIVERVVELIGKLKNINGASFRRRGEE